MPNFTAGTSFTDGVTNDVTAAKLNALVADAVPTSSLALNSTNGTISNFTSSTATITGAITGSTNVINIGSGQIYKDASGAVGIGTTSPATKLDVSGTISASGATGVGVNMLATGTGGRDYRIASTDNANGLGGGKFTIYDQTAGSSRVLIDSSGNVGIGITSPSYKLDVRGGSAAIINSTGDSYLYLGEGTGANQYGYLQWDNTNNAFVIGAEPVPIIFTNGTERLRIDSSGQVGIGTASPSAQLELSTDSAKKPSTNTWTIASDQRLKTNITNADNDRCYEIVKQVPLKRYTWKSEVYSQEQVKDRSKLGWIAQDVEAVFPKAVGTNRFAYNQVFEDVVTPELDSDGNALLDENGVAKTKTEKRLVSEDVIEDCKDLNSDQIYAAMYGTIQKLIEKVELLESKVATLEAA
jgi:hypothetical protein